jgi:hypothetical protein
LQPQQPESDVTRYDENEPVEASRVQEEPVPRDVEIPRVTLQDEELSPVQPDADQSNQDLVRNRRTFGSFYINKGVSNQQSLLNL